MKFTIPGKDIISINDEDLEYLTPPESKVHLIKLNLKNPTLNGVDLITGLFHKTNRYVVDMENVRFYNGYFKNTNIKYYVINTEGYYTGIISFFKRNNKVLFDTTILDEDTKDYINTPDVLMDILSNVEVIIIEPFYFDLNKEIFERWNGNVILHDEDYII